MASKRDNAYFEERLKTEHPKIHQDFKRGVYRSLSDALIACGLRKPRTRLHELRNAWKRASAAERSTFLQDIGVTSTLPTTAAPITAAPAMFVNRRLTPAGKAALSKFMTSKGFGVRMGQVMKMIGRSTSNQSLSLAMAQDTQVADDVIRDVEKLLSDEGYWP